MSIKILPKKLNGGLTVPPSKSYVHRILIADFLADLQSGNVSKDNFIDSQITEFCDDTLATKNSLNSMLDEYPILDCNESGSTLRFLMPLCGVLNEHGGLFKLKGTLRRRPILPFLNILRDYGCDFEIFYNDSEIEEIELTGNLRADNYKFDANMSSQLLTGLLYSLPILKNSSNIYLTKPLISKPYIKVTLALLYAYGIKIGVNSDLSHFHIPPNQIFVKPGKFHLEPDFSSSAYFLLINKIQNMKERTFHSIDINNLPFFSLQADGNILNLLDSIPALLLEAESREQSVTSIDLIDSPDLLPVLSIYAAVMDSDTAIRFENIGRLTTKESNRIESCAALVRSLGGKVLEASDSLTIFPNGLKGKENAEYYEVDSFNDHRIAMTAAAASTFVDKPIILHGSECVSKSFPRFWEIFTSLGGQIDAV